MAHLSVRNFSCIDIADIDLGKLTILIGPQASGKSVISKLIHFCNDLLTSSFTEFDFVPRTFDDLIATGREDFIKAFPQSAWGTTSFSIVFEAGPIGVRISRTKPRKKTHGRLNISFTDEFLSQYELFSSELDAVKIKTRSTATDTLIGRDWEIHWKIRQAALDRLNKLMGTDAVSGQLFIPAGRSFFTSMGKAVIAFEQGGFLDPLTIRFGKFFIAVREQHGVQAGYFFGKQVKKEILTSREDLSKDLFSGTLRMERNDEYVLTSDGRKIPFSFLSSGQQELFPLWLTLNAYVDIVDKQSVIFIEEPEAHLFPAAQGRLAEYLAQILNQSPSVRMLITTHSPYMLTVMNNLLTAGRVGRKLKKVDQHKVEAVVARNSWLRSDQTSAYAIIDRCAYPIMDIDGLIDADYLDSVSGNIGDEYLRLLGLEVKK